MCVDQPPEPSEILQLLDEHHLTVLADNDAVRLRFSLGLHESLRAIPETDVIMVDGTDAVDLPGLIAQLTPRLAETYGAPGALGTLMDVLRARPGRPRYRYIIWQDADVMLEQDVDLFGRVVNAICLFAADDEHFGDRSLTLHRLILIGRSKLGAYAEDDQGQLNVWRENVFEIDPLLERVRPVLPNPRFLVYRVDE